MTKQEEMNNDATACLDKEQQDWDKYWMEIEKKHPSTSSCNWQEKNLNTHVYKNGNGNLVIDDGNTIDLLDL